MISGTSFPVGISLLGFFESFRDHVFGLLPAAFYVIIAPCPCEDALSAFVIGMLTKDSARQSSTAAVLCIARSVLLSASPESHKITTAEEALTGLVRVAKRVKDFHPYFLQIGWCVQVS